MLIFKLLRPHNLQLFFQCTLTVSNMSNYCLSFTLAQTVENTDPDWKLTVLMVTWQCFRAYRKVRLNPSTPAASVLYNLRLWTQCGFVFCPLYTSFCCQNGWTWQHNHCKYVSVDYTYPKSHFPESRQFHVFPLLCCLGTQHTPSINHTVYQTGVWICSDSWH